MMLIDAFLYAGERDMAALRWQTLKDHVDIMVPVVCSLTHQGEPVNIDAMTWLPPADAKLYAPYVVHPRRTFQPGGRSVAGKPFYQLIERQHRAGVWDAVHRLSPDVNDIVMVSDVDEIPSPNTCDTLRQYFDFDFPFVMEQRMHSDRLHLLHPKQPWLGTTVSRWHNCDPHAHRQLRGEMVRAGHVIHAAGWHFSWFGTDEQRAWKVRSFSHGEVADSYDPAEGRRTGHHSNGETLIPIDMRDYDWPEPISNGTFAIPREWT